MNKPIQDYKTAQEIKALDYINDALDEIGIPRDTGITRQTYTTWGRVSVLIDRYKRSHPELFEPAAEDAAPLVFAGGEVDEMTRAGSGMGEDEVLPY